MGYELGLLIGLVWVTYKAMRIAERIGFKRGVACMAYRMMIELSPAKGHETGVVAERLAIVLAEVVEAERNGELNDIKQTGDVL